MIQAVQVLCDAAYANTQTNVNQTIAMKNSRPFVGFSKKSPFRQGHLRNLLGGNPSDNLDTSSTTTTSSATPKQSSSGIQQSFQQSLFHFPQQYETLDHLIQGIYQYMQRVLEENRNFRYIQQQFQQNHNLRPQLRHYKVQDESHHSRVQFHESDLSQRLKELPSDLQREIFHLQKDQYQFLLVHEAFIDRLLYLSQFTNEQTEVFKTSTNQLLQDFQPFTAEQHFHQINLQRENFQKLNNIFVHYFSLDDEAFLQQNLLLHFGQKLETFAKKYIKLEQKISPLQQENVKKQSLPFHQFQQQCLDVLQECQLLLVEVQALHRNYMILRDDFIRLLKTYLEHLGLQKQFLLQTQVPTNPFQQPFLKLQTFSQQVSQIPVRKPQQPSVPVLPLPQLPLSHQSSKEPPESSVSPLKQLYLSFGGLQQPLKPVRPLKQIPLSRQTPQESLVPVQTLQQMRSATESNPSLPTPLLSDSRRSPLSSPEEEEDCCNVKKTAV